MSNQINNVPTVRTIYRDSYRFIRCYQRGDYVKMPESLKIPMVSLTAVFVSALVTFNNRAEYLRGWQNPLRYHQFIIGIIARYPQLYFPW